MSSFLDASWWIADLLANLRMQWFISAVACMVILTAVRKPRWAVASIVVVVAALTPVWKAQISVAAKHDADSREQSSPLIVATFNVLSTNTKHDVIVEQIRRADAHVLAIVELSTPLAERIRREFLNEYPHFIEQPQDHGNFGIGLYSRFPLEDGRIFRLAAPQVPSVEATIQHADQRYRLYATHPVPPLPASGFENRNQHLQELSDRIVRHDDAHQPFGIIVMGDLNVTPWSPVFQRFCGSARLLRSHNSIQPTWYAKPVFPCGLVLDHILVSEKIRCAGFYVATGAGSDHRLIRAELHAAEEAGRDRQ
ncbi:MAG: endonuclease/exonuclease/phosphatase family protein [Planctomycetaceae bacterium]|nr:endonuclease/exonuclease/phosphatase family protein [Planctomycetaceae bacterium]